MMDGFYDLTLRDGSALEFMDRLGWKGACVIRQPAPKTKLDLLTGEEVSDDVMKKARKALESADLVVVNAGDERMLREASECWEVDSIITERLDHVAAKFMAERGIALQIELQEIIETWGSRRSKFMESARRNVKVARKYKVPVVLGSGATGKFQARSPREIAAVGMMFGMTREESVAAVSSNPQALVKKARDRKDPDVILKGLRVVSWVGQKPRDKKQYGWY